MAESKNVFDTGSRFSIFKFDPDEIQMDAKLNGRQDLPDIEWLIQSILKDGQLEPVTVRKDGKNPCLVAGFSRWRAIREINKRKLLPEPMPILATYFRGNERDGFVANISENRFRNSTTPLDDAHNIAQLLKWQMSEEQIAGIYFPTNNGDAAALKKNIAWVKRTVKLADLSAEAKDAVREGRVKPSAAAHIAKLAAESQKELVKKQGKITSSDVRKAAGKKALTGIAVLKKLITKAANDLETPNGHKIPRDVADWLIEICEG